MTIDEALQIVGTGAWEVSSQFREAIYCLLDERAALYEQVTALQSKSTKHLLDARAAAFEAAIGAIREMSK